MKKELLFSETKESKKEYLSRMAILLDIIRNFPDLKASHPLLMTMDDTDLKEFENYLWQFVYHKTQWRLICRRREVGSDVLFMETMADNR